MVFHRYKFDFKNQTAERICWYAAKGWYSDSLIMNGFRPKCELSFCIGAKAFSFVPLQGGVQAMVIASEIVGFSDKWAN